MGDFLKSVTPRQVAGELCARRLVSGELESVSLLITLAVLIFGAGRPSYVSAADVSIVRPRGLRFINGNGIWRFGCLC
jgi:hypothetical protein